MKKFICILIATVVLATVGCSSKTVTAEYADGDQYEQIGGELNILNWGEYIDPELITLFEQETGVKVTYSEMTSNEDMLIKLSSSDSIYDLCFPSEYIIEQMIASDMLQPLDMSKIPNSKNIAADKLKITDTFDPGNKYSLPYMWGTVGILYNTTMVDEQTASSWNALWNESYSGKIWMYDSVRDSLGVSLLRLGYDLNTRNEDEVAAARDELIKQRPLLAGYGTDNMRDEMINGNAAMCLIYSGDALMCMDSNEDLAFSVPMEGSNVWFDNVVIPKNATNIEAAHAFINFLNDGQIAMRNTEYIYYSTPNQAAMDRLDTFYTENETYNPTEETLERCSVFHDLGDFIEVFNDAWKQVKIN